MNSRALNRLSWLLMRGSVRKIFRLLKTPSGLAMSLAMLGIFAVGVLPSFIVAFQQHEIAESPTGQIFHALFSVLMLAAIVVAITTNGGKSLLELSPPELQFVLAGPFTDSQILTYRLQTILCAWIPIAGIFSLILSPHFGTMSGAFIGTIVVAMFLIVTTLLYSLVTPKVSAALRTTTKTALQLLLLLCIVDIAVNISQVKDDWSITSLTGLVADCRTVGVLNWCLDPFRIVLFSTQPPEIFANAGIAVLMVLAVTLGCYKFNSGFAELAVEGVSRRQKKLQRIKSGNLYGSSSKHPDRTRSLPEFPWCFGAGPIAWSQTTMVLRRVGKLLLSLNVLGAAVAVGGGIYLRINPELLSQTQRGFAVPIAMVPAIYIGFLISMSAQTGLTSNPRILFWYQTLPVGPHAIGVGMVAGTVTLLAGVLIPFWFVGFAITSHWWLESLSIFLVGFSFVVAYASTMNLVVAVTGLRPMPTGTPDVLQGARAMIYMFVLGLAMIPTMLFAVGAVGISAALFGLDWTLCSLASALVILAFQPILWWLTGSRFQDRDFNLS